MITVNDKVNIHVLALPPMDIGWFAFAPIPDTKTEDYEISEYGIYLDNDYIGIVDLHTKIKNSNLIHGGITNTGILSEPGNVHAEIIGLIYKGYDDGTTYIVTGKHYSEYVKALAKSNFGYFHHFEDVI